MAESDPAEMSTEDRRHLNLRWLIDSQCDGNPEHFMELLRDYLLRNCEAPHDDWPETIRVPTHDLGQGPFPESLATAIEKAFGLTRGWMDWDHAESEDEAMEAQEDLIHEVIRGTMVPIITSAELIGLLEGDLEYEDVRCEFVVADDNLLGQDIERGFVSFFDEYDRALVAMPVQDDSMFSPFQSRAFLPNNSMAIIELFIEDEEYRDPARHANGTPVLTYEAEFRTYTFRIVSGTSLVPTNPSFAHAEPFYDEVAGVVVASYQNFD